MPYPEVVSAQLQRQVILTVVPVGSAPSAVLFARRFARYGVTTPIMLMALILFSLLGHGSFIAVLVPVFGWLAITGSLSTTVLIAAVALVVAVLVVSGVGLTTLQRGSIPLWAQRRLPHRVTGFIDEALATGVPAQGLAAPFAIAISVDLLGIAMLWTALRSLGAPSSLEIAAGGYVIGTLFLMIAPLFQGIGIVEITMALALERLGVPTAEAFGATLLYRLGEVWVPLAVGIAIQIRAQEHLRRLPRNLPALIPARPVCSACCR